MRTRVRVSVAGSVLTLLLVVSVAAIGAPVAVASSVADAAARGDTEGVRALLRDGADVNAAQGDGMTALHWTAINGDLETMTVLVYAGATLDPLTRIGAYTPLHLASAEGHGAVVAYLLGAGASVDHGTATGTQPIHLAAQSGDVVAIEALLEHGAEVDVRDATHGRTPLIFATSKNRIEAIEVLIARGADVYLATTVIDYVARSEADNQARAKRQRVKDAESGRPGGAPRGPSQLNPQAQAQAQAAARGAQPGARGATRGGQPDPDDPDDPPGTPRGRDGDDDADDEPAALPDPRLPRSLGNTEQIGTQGGFAAIHYASRDGFDDAARILLDAGTDIDLLTTGDHSSPMLVATINGNYDLAMEYLARGADPNLASDDGATPLFAAINQEWHLRTWYPQPTANEQQQASYLELMEALLKAGADPDARTGTHIWYAAYNAGRMGVDFTGATAFWRAAYALDIEAMKLLKRYGADHNLATYKLPSRSRGGFNLNATFLTQGDGPEEDPSGLPPVPVGGPHVSPLHAATGVGFGTSRVAQQHRSVPDGWLPAARYLIEELGMDINIRDADGFAPLHNAAARGDNEMVLYLIEMGADPLVVNRRGQTTVDMANSPEQRTQPYPETIALLERFGGINNHNCRACD